MSSSQANSGVSIGGRRLPARFFDRLRELAEEDAALATVLNTQGTDHRAAANAAKRRAALLPIMQRAERLTMLRGQMEEARSLIAQPTDADLAALAAEELPALEASAAEVVDELLSRLVSAEDDAVGSVIVELRSGTGGDEAALWCRDLLEIYTRFAQQRSWTLELLDLTAEPTVGGVRHAVLSLKGTGVWSCMAFEAGVHSVKRVPATETQGRIHTSTATVAVLPEPEEVEVRVDWAKDVEEHVTTSQGPGGQNVNKVATAVQLHHRPSGITIRMQESKSQQQNRERARRLLMARLHELERNRKHAQRSAARRSQIGSGERSEKIRTYRWKEGIVADERLAGEYPLREILSGNLDHLMADLHAHETARRVAEL
ncbi:MAG: PCRF domain-containing protein [Phycisphaeraceae bacterium]|nr:PCRF domain-containing protein [Phycisphaeraceae bacterium]